MQPADDYTLAKAEAQKHLQDLRNIANVVYGERLIVEEAVKAAPATTDWYALSENFNKIIAEDRERRAEADTYDAILTNAEAAYQQAMLGADALLQEILTTWEPTVLFMDRKNPEGALQKVVGPYVLFKKNAIKNYRDAVGF